MDKKEIKLCDRLYWNTTGAYNTNISLKCTVLDIGVLYIWIQVDGNLSPTPVHYTRLSKEPLYKVTNNRSD